MICENHQNETNNLDERIVNQPNSAAGNNVRTEVSLNDLQDLIHQMYFQKDVARGVEGTFVWLVEEIGELATALKSGDRENMAEEFADVLAWLATIANVTEINLNDAIVKKYGGGCPGCGKLVCGCPDEEKP
jgi:NTP pyrophosphatase (non-canonical NTP hydrolase)